MIMWAADSKKKSTPFVGSNLWTTMSIGTTIPSLFKIAFPEWNSAISIPRSEFAQTSYFEKWPSDGKNPCDSKNLMSCSGVA